MLDVQFALVLFVIFFSSLVRVVFGFGNGLISMPLLVLLIGVEGAVPLTSLCAVVVTAFMLLGDFRSVQIRPVIRLVAASLAGIPIGLLVVKHLSESVVSISLGLFLLWFGASRLRRKAEARTFPGWMAWPCGFLAGILGSAFNVPGPPIVAYASSMGWKKDHFRANMQGYFIFIFTSVMIGHGMAGMWTDEVMGYFKWCAVPMLASWLLGKWIAERIPEHDFTRYVYMLLLMLGAVMTVRELTGLLA